MFKKFKKVTYFSLPLIILGVATLLSGCSNSLDRWSKATAYKLLSRANKGYKVKIIKCSKSHAQWDYRVADCTYYLIWNGKIRYFNDEGYKKKTLLANFYRDRHSKYHKKWKVALVYYAHPHMHDPIKEMQRNGMYY